MFLQSGLTIAGENLFLVVEKYCFIILEKSVEARFLFYQMGG